jgi:putative redox protein
MKFNLEDTGAFSAELDYGKLDISSNTEIGFRPIQLLVSSLAGCSGGLLKRVLHKKRIAFDAIEIEVDIERSEGEVNKVTKIMLHFIVIGKNLRLSQIQKSLDLAVKNCAMIQSVNSAIDVMETIEVRENGVT